MSDHAEHIKNILKEFYRTKPAEGEALGDFLSLFVGKILAYVPKDEQETKDSKKIKI